jgi:hypothetical protein
VFCSCSFKVVVPLLEEFEKSPVLPSARTIERRVMRLLTDGELPLTHACQACGVEGELQVAVIGLQCEKATIVRRVQVISRTWTPVVTVVKEKHWLEQFGRDTEVPAPISLCPGCLARLLHSRARVFAAATLGLLLAGALGVALSCVFLWGLGWKVGVCLALLAPVLLWLRRREGRRQQRRWKEVVGKVPAYRQVLDRYPHAVVHLKYVAPERPRDVGDVYDTED